MILRVLLPVFLATLVAGPPLPAQTSGGGGVSTGGHGGPTASPFSPFNPQGGGGGFGGPPPDAGGGSTGDGGKGSGPETSSAPAQSRADRPRNQGSRQAGGSRANSAADPARSFLVVADTWDVWWETNKFDFIELRRTSDTPLTGQGPFEESDEARQQRGAATRAVVQENVLPVLRKLTSASDPAVRASAIVALAKLQDTESTELTRSMLSDSNFDVRRSAMLAMGLLDAGRSSYLLMNIADDSPLGRKLLKTSRVTDEDRGVALLTGALREQTSASLLLDQLLENPGPLPNELLAAACEAAGLSGDSAAIPFLTQVANDPDRLQFVRASATSALGRLGDPAAMPSLIKLLDSVQEPRRAAVIALGLLAHRSLPDVVHRLVELLEDSDGPTRHFAAISLGRIGGPDARTALAKQLRTGKSDMRPWTALALGLVARQDPEAEIPSLLMEHLKDESNVESAGAYLIALGLVGHGAQTGRRSVLPWDAMLTTLGTHLHGSRVQLSGSAALALGLTRHPEAGRMLRVALENGNSPIIQRQIALGLGVLGNGAAIPDLLDLMRTTANPFVASFAAIGIAFMGDADAIGPLLRMIEVSGDSGVTTTYAVLAVGQLLDDDRRPALSRLAAGDNYLARPSSVSHLLSLGF
jgi:HEAT repeat protein